MALCKADICLLAGLATLQRRAYVYKHYIRRFYMNPHSTTMWYIPRKGLFHKQDDVLTAAERYMEEHGTEAFERLISKVRRLLHDAILVLGLTRPDPLV